MTNTLIDAGPIIALFDRDDQYHRKVYEFMRDFEGRLITTWPVLTEVSHMLDFHKQAQLDFIDWVGEGGIKLYNLEQWQLFKMRTIVDNYDDLSADFADASLLVAANDKNVENILSLDKDFQVYRLESGKPLVNLLLS